MRYLTIIKVWGKVRPEGCYSHGYFCLNTISLKNILYAVSFFILTIVCACSGQSSAKPIVEDSLNYYPSTPTQLSKEEFRHYHRTLTAFFDSVLLNRAFNGGILVAKGGAILYEHYEGNVDIRRNDNPVTDSSAFHLASTGKTFTSVAILRMIQENKLSLQDSINKFFPDLPYPGITVKMLLSHRSGLPNYIYFVPNSNWDKKTYVTNDDVLNMLYTLKPNRMFTAGTRFSYCNTNFVMLALIIEKISGMKFPDYMQQHIFKPLMMEHTYVYTLADSARSTPSFNYNNSFWANDNLDLTYGDKNIYSTPRDLLKWDQALYNDEFLHPDMRDSAFTPQSNERVSMHNYGLGFRLLTLPNGKRAVYHFGRWHGFNAAFGRLPDEKVVVIILGNRFTSRIYEVARETYNLFGEYADQQSADDDEGEQTVTEKTAPPKKVRAPVKKRRAPVKKRTRK
jgi:CubicO group peptidase (beta-lactamase class C family)